MSEMNDLGDANKERGCAERRSSEDGEHLASATLDIAAGLTLNWGENWDDKMRAEITGHLSKVAHELRRLGYQ